MQTTRSPRHRRSRWRRARTGLGASGKPGGRLYLSLLVVFVASTVLFVGGYLSESPAPPAPAAALGTIPAAMTGPTKKPAPGKDGALGVSPTSVAAPGPVSEPLAMAPSSPVSVRAPSIGVDSTLGQVGLNPDRTIEVPTSYTQAGWYRLGPTPGAIGPAVILGHVDSFKGPGVFFNLGDLRPGRDVDVTREDKTVAHFRVDAIKTYPKSDFPTQDVYGAINYAGLRLITCGGTFDTKTRSYDSNTVVYASLAR